MQVTVERPQPCEAVINVEVDDQQMEQAKGKAYRKFANYINVPGFRPGKAPRQVLEKMVDEVAVKESARDLVIEIAYPAALKDAGLDPYGQGTVTEVVNEEDKPFSFKATVPLRPEVELGDYAQLTAKRPVLNITEEQVDGEINGILRDRGRLQPIDAPAEDEDVLFTDMETSADGEPIGSRRSATFQLGQNMPEIDSVLQGSEAGATRETDITYPEDFADEAMAGKTVHFTFHVNHVLRRVTPDLTDEWVAEHTTAENVDDLRRIIRETLERSAEQASEQEVRRQLLDEVASRSEVHFPSALVDAEVSDDLRRLKDQLESRESDVDQYLEQRGQTITELQDEMALAARQRIKNGLVMGRIAQVEDLGLTKDDIEGELKKIAEVNGLKLSEVRRRLRDEDQMPALEERLLQDKLFGFLKGRATITDEQTTA